MAGEFIVMAGDASLYGPRVSGRVVLVTALLSYLAMNLGRFDNTVSQLLPRN